MEENGRFLHITERLMSWGVFIALLATYLLTVAPSVSYWDCPEYVAAAWRLEVGHPPGNPLWMLVERVLTMFLPDGTYAALVVNMSSGLFTALAALFLAKSVFIAWLWISDGRNSSRSSIITAATAGSVAALSFGWCDSAWYSAVEAEVYAMSAFLTSLMVWLAVKGAFARDKGTRFRYIVLTAYLTGLSIGVHQLNLLALPAIAVIFCIPSARWRGRRLWLPFLLATAIVGCILGGMMPSTAMLCGRLELWAVNTLGLPFDSGFFIYLTAITVAVLTALILTGRKHNLLVTTLSLWPLLLLSGLFIFTRMAVVNLAFSLFAAVIISLLRKKFPSLPALTAWSVTMLLAGYSVYLLIPVRGAVASPANGMLPSDPFSFSSYIAREQYGSKPLLYGPTAFSKRMSMEHFGSDGKPDYSRLALEKVHPVYRPAMTDPKLKKSHIFTDEDSIFNAGVLSHEGDRYLLSDYRTLPVQTPELNMWFPRITGQRPSDIQAYGDWLGMYPSTMTEVEVTEAFDSLGNAVNRLSPDGKRMKKSSVRPTYLQNLQWMLQYQIGYMYFRYLMWNFSGRQNDIPSTGEVEHGNFITGFPIIDNAMLGAEEMLPPDKGTGNPGRNIYFMLPLLMGLWGIATLLFSRERGRKVCLVVALIFIMTGVAIVVYLNQSPGEPRERDYSFLGSFMAFAAWIGFGGADIGRRIFRIVSKLLKPGRRPTRGLLTLVSVIPAFCIPVLMLCRNVDDHDRSNRIVAAVIARNLLESLDEDALLFVDGDNSTFPLWYAQEVEGIRRDVRVINISYLSLPSYVVALKRDWEGSDGVPMHAEDADIIYGGCSLVRIAPEASDTMSAHAAFSRFFSQDLENFPATTITIPGCNGEAAVNLRNLMRENSSAVIPFRNFAMLDIISANLEQPSPRPVYWLASAPARAFSGLRDNTSQSLLTYRFGKSPEADSILLRKAARLKMPVPEPESTYIDHAPEVQIIFQRGAVTAAAVERMHAGNLKVALTLAVFADSVYGRPFRNYGVIAHADTTFNVARNLAVVLETCGKTLGDSAAVNRAREIRKLEILRKNERQLYIKSLPERLKDKTVK